MIRCTSNTRLFSWMQVSCDTLNHTLGATLVFGSKVLTSTAHRFISSTRHIFLTSRSTGGHPNLVSDRLKREGESSRTVRCWTNNVLLICPHLSRFISDDPQRNQETGDSDIPTSFKTFCLIPWVGHLWQLVTLKV